jgi:hypothetical protein
MAAQPVMPGFIRWRWAYSATSLALSIPPRRSSWSARAGRGPTSDISPFSTLNSCGSSSRLVRRMKRPTRVTRSSSALTCGGRLVGRWSWRMERNFQTTISSLLKPWRRWRKKIGPGLSSLMARAISAISGAAEHQRQSADHQILQPLDQRAALVADAPPRPAPAACRPGATGRRRGSTSPWSTNRVTSLGSTRSCSTSSRTRAWAWGVHGDHHPVDIGHDAVAEQRLVSPSTGTPAMCPGCGRCGRRTRPAPPRRGASARGDQPLGVGGGADDDDVGGQPAGPRASGGPIAHQTPCSR